MDGPPYMEVTTSGESPTLDVCTFTSYDPEGGDVQWSLSGNDSAAFTITPGATPAEGATVSFKTLFLTTRIPVTAASTTATTST